VNDVTDAKTLMHLLKYDSVFGKFQASLQAEKDGFSVDGE
jgi:glyceraldehyde 3-phosphate dehydrogenase